MAYAENFDGGGLVQGHMVVICIWCALFMTSQFDVISMFPNQCFGEVCWHSMHIFLQPLSLFYVSLHWIWTISAPSQAIGEKQTQRYHTAVHTFKKNRLRITTGGWNTLITTPEKLTTTKSGCPKVSPNTGSWALKVYSWTGWRTRRFARSNFAKADKVRKKICVCLWCLDVHRPETRGANPPLQKFSPPQEKCAGRILNILHIV